MLTNTALKICLSAGESSGDQNAANLYLELKKQFPKLNAVGMGGAKMADAGISLCYDSSQIAVIGVVEVIKHYAEIRRALKKMQNLLLNERPDLLICVDYKDFNYQLAKFAKQNGIKVLFYVSPQVWVWRKNRVKKYGKVIDMMAVIFPFETAYYEAENVPVRYVGHPSVDKAIPNFTKSEALEKFHLNPCAPVIGLVAGSRVNEIKHLLPVMLEAAEHLKVDFQNCQFILPQADSLPDDLIQHYLNQAKVSVTVIKNQPYDVMQCCDAIMTCSGTATLEIALLGIPMVICYRLNSLTYWLGRLLIKTRFIGLPNIVFGDGIVRELIQHDATAENLANEIHRLLTDSEAAQNCRADLEIVREKLGQGGGIQNMTALVLE
ncbi:MAG: lipid-A-disaccharide synthase, partial [Methylococcales bacterium]|nr:lipid-A-disaccharide synthase [Methylococcales bacterium]